MKNFNALIDNQPIKSKQEAYEKLVNMSRNDDFTTANLLDYLYHQKYYKTYQDKQIQVFLNKLISQEK